MGTIPNLIEAALILIVAFLLGCIIGWFLRAKLFRRRQVVSPVVKKTPVAGQPALKAQSAPVTKTISKPKIVEPPKPTPKAKPVTKTQPQAENTGKPEGLKAPRNGKKDDLKKIKGIGPKLETTLNGLGIYHFDQIAGWSRKEIDWVDDFLSFKGRIDRDQWISQAKDLK